MTPRSSGWRPAGLAFALYLLASIVLVGHGTYAHFGSTTIGYGPDPPIFIWDLEWWPRAIIDGFSLLHPNIVFAPEGFNTTLITSIAAPSFVMAPVTLLAGPLVSYNLLAILIPAVNGWAAYLLCRAAGAGTWPGIVGGYLFGFSSYVLAQSLGHPNLSLVAMVPLAAYLVLRRQQGTISNRTFLPCLVGVLIFQFLTSTEVFLTMTLVGVTVFALSFALFPAQRRELLTVAKWTILAYAVAGLVVSPYVISFLTANQSFDHIHPTEFVTEPLNLVMPTRLTVGGNHFYSITDRFTGNLSENAAYFGIPILVMLALFAWERRRDRVAQLLLAAFAIALVASLGPRSIVLGAATGPPLPWEPLTHLPLTRYVLPQRLIVFAWLAVALITALWLSSGKRMRPARWILVLVGLALLLPDPRAVDPGHAGAELWSSARPLPRLFASGDRPLFRGHPNLLVLPYNEAGDANSTYWQANTGMAYAMPGGYVSGTLPSEFSCWPLVALLRVESYPEADPQELLDFLAAKDVDGVLMPPETASVAAPMLDQLKGPRRLVDGMVFIPVRGQRGPARAPEACTETAAGS
jgi:hypothetical protein